MISFSIDIPFLQDHFHRFDQRTNKQMVHPFSFYLFKSFILRLVLLSYKFFSFDWLSYQTWIDLEYRSDLKKWSFHLLVFILMFDTESVQSNCSHQTPLFRFLLIDNQRIILVAKIDFLLFIFKGSTKRIRSNCQSTDVAVENAFRWQIFSLFFFQMSTFSSDRERERR